MTATKPVAEFGSPYMYTLKECAAQVKFLEERDVTKHTYKCFKETVPAWAPAK